MCTAATYKTKDFYFGRTLDYECSYGDQIVIMRLIFSMLAIWKIIMQLLEWLMSASNSSSRFVRVAFTKVNAISGESEEESVSQFFHILGSVD